MGVVYRARDERLRRDVALKVLPPEAVGEAKARARLLAEARAAAALNHPGICTIYDVGEEGDEVFVAMELVEGTRLDALSGRLDPDRTRRIAVQLAAAVGHAHDSGIVHRDLKGSNLMLTADGRVKVLDFGLATRVRMDVSEMSRSQTTLDPTGTLAGTLAYMAPEALSGEPPDPRSDVWALGVVFYELLTGSRPFGGSTAHELASAILRDPPRPLPADTPSDMVVVVARCLAKPPGERYARAGEVRAALEVSAAPETVRAAPSVPRGGRWRAAAVGFALALVALGGVAALRLASRPARPRVDAIAVLPFENLSHDPAQEYFSDGMTDQLITTLAKIGSLRVTSRASVMRWKGAPRPPAEVGRALDVGAIIEGSVLRDRERVRIGVQLVDTASERHLWAESYERDASDVLRLQAEIARAIADQVQARLTPREAEQLAGARRIDPRAHDLLLLGQHHARQRNAEAATRAVELLRQAVTIDPGSGLAHAALANAYREQDTWASLGPGRSAALIRSEATRAVELDPDLAEAHLALARVHLEVDWDWPAAERELGRALELNQSLAEAHMVRAFLMQTLGDDVAAVSAADRAAKLEPLSPLVLSDYGRTLYRARRFQEAVAQFRRALDLDPDFVPALVRLADTYVLLAARRELSEACVRLERVSERLPAFALDVLRVSLALLEGRRDEARRRIETIERGLGARPAGEYAFSLACLYAPVDTDRALAWLERGVRERALFPLQLRDPLLDPVRGDPRFRALLAQLRMPEQER
jgi:serine/threonine-protein kinase